jgi:hypothetical protein
MGFFYRSGAEIPVDPLDVLDVTESALDSERVADPELRRAKRDSLLTDTRLGHLLPVAKERKSGKLMTTSNAPSGWVLFFVTLLLIGLYLTGYFLEGSPSHPQASAMAFNAFQIAFPGFLGLLGIETAKHG